MSPNRVENTPLAAPLHLIELDGVTRSYDVGDITVTALADVSLAVDEGEFVAVLGPSGSGKTTLLNMIGALDKPTAGQVTINGRDVTGASRGALFELRRTTVSFIFQTFNLFPGLTALENNQRVRMMVRMGQKGPMADSVELIS